MPISLQGVAAWATAGLAVVALLGWVPYFEGYGPHRETLFHYFLKSRTDYNGEWVHCLFVPLFVAWIAFLRWPLLRSLPVQGDFPLGLAALVAGCGLYWLGYAAENNYIGFAALEVIDAGLILWFLGRGWMRELLFPWLFLLFMWPWGFLDNLLAFPLRLLMSFSAHHLLSLVGIANVLSGTALLSAADFSRGFPEGSRFQIDVADPCSGLRSMFALFMIASFYGYFLFGISSGNSASQNGNFSRQLTSLRGMSGGLKIVAMIGAAIPLAILGNVIRILLLVFANLTFGPRFALGTEFSASWFHLLAGFMVFVIALGGLVALGRALGALGRRDLGSNDSSEGSVTPDGTSHPLFWKCGGVGALVSLTIGLCLMTPEPSSQSDMGVVMRLPDRVGDWWGIDGKASTAESLFLPADTQLVRKVYDSGDGSEIVSTIVLSGAERRSIHRPEICLPGQGWSIQSGKVIAIPLHARKPLRVTQLTMSRWVTGPKGPRQVRAYYIYWFVGQGVMTPSHLKRIWLTIWDRLVHHRNHRWAYVSAFSLVSKDLSSSGKTPEETTTMMESFLADSVESYLK